MKSLANAMLALFLVAGTSACVGKTIKGEISGDMQISNLESCTMRTPPGICYDVNGSLAGGDLQFSGSGFFDPTACTTSSKMGVCCPQNVTGNAIGSHDGQTAEFDFSYMGQSCVKSKTPTTAKLSKGVLMITGTAGALQGAKGMGTVKYTETCDSDCSTANPGVGSGKIHVSGHETEKPAD